MKCPLLLMGCYITEKETKAQHEECLKEKCAWWNIGLECCHIRQIAISLEVLSDSLDEISEKMPYGKKSAD